MPNKTPDSSQVASRLASKHLAAKIKEHLQLIDQICKEEPFLEFSSSFRKRIKIAVDRTKAGSLSKQDVSAYFSWVLQELPTLIEAYKPFLGLNKSKQHTFWNVVTALDRARRTLRVAKTLTKLFDCAAKVEPGPLRKLIDHYESGSCSPDDAKLIRQLAEYMDAGSTKLPPDLKAYGGIFKMVRSQHYKMLESRRDLEGACSNLSNYLAFVDFYWQSRAWIDCYLELLTEIYGLALEVGNVCAAERINKVFYRDACPGQIKNPGTRFAEVEWTFPNVHRGFAEDDLNGKRAADKERQRLHRQRRNSRKA